VRRLIINADDFGLTAGVNRGILQASQQGVVTSATLMACGAAFNAAVEAARSAKGLALGCHLVLLDGEPISPASDVPTLMEGDRFRRDVMRFGLAAIAKRIAPEHIELEVAAQIRRLQAAGIEVTHVDTHKHSHIFPAVLRPLVRACQACGVSKIRNPFLPSRLRSDGGGLRLWKRLAQLRLLDRFRRSFSQTIQAAGMLSTDGSVGVVATGSLEPLHFERILKALPEGTWEFVCHPGYNDDDLASVNTRLRESREIELEIMTSPGSRQLIRSENIELISYRELT
jgi:chitin disaccharide deacetylase